MGLLALWALVPSVVLSYLVWAALGLRMAAILYEPIFAIVGKAIDHAGDRLRAIATITVMLVAALGGLPLPLLPLHLLWINVVTDGLPALALVVDPPERMSSSGSRVIQMSRFWAASSGAPSSRPVCCWRRHPDRVCVGRPGARVRCEV